MPKGAALGLILDRYFFTVIMILIFRELLNYSNDVPCLSGRSLAQNIQVSQAVLGLHLPLMILFLDLQMLQFSL